MTLSPATYVVRIQVPRQPEGFVSREAFYDDVWRRFGGDGGLEGVHEGTILSEEAAEQGLETESFTVDAAEAPRERDWIAGQVSLEVLLYFPTRAQAEACAEELGGTVEEQPAQDWDREWRMSFLGSPEGVRVPPDWRIVPPWVTDAEARIEAHEQVLRINPGAGFGTGTHETTQLCLQAIAECLAGKPAAQVLDFGSGSGILSIGAALRGAEVWAVEIDPLANDNAADNSQLNGVESRVHISLKFDSMVGAPAKFDLVVANILRPVLEAFADALVEKMKPGAPLVLSGLVAEDVDRIVAAYAPKLGGRKPDVLIRGDWRCLVWR